MTSTARTSVISQPATASPAHSASHASGVSQPASTRAMPPSGSSSPYTSTYRSGLSGSGTGNDHNPGRTCSTGGSTLSCHA